MSSGLFIDRKLIQLRSRIVRTRTWTKLWSSCQARFPEMKREHPNTPPDRFLVFDSAGIEVRRWFASGRPKS